MPDLRVLHHAQCFDGFASAAVFTAFYDEYTATENNVVYRGLRHGPNSRLQEHLFDCPVNAVVDFRYSSSQRLDWWFDHHKSAFPTVEDRAIFDERASGTHHWDPNEPSCAGFMVRRIRELFGTGLPHLDSLVEWADIIDSASFDDAAQAVELEEPVLQLMTVCEHLQDGPLAHRLIYELSEGNLETIACDPEIQRRFDVIIEEQIEGQDIVESRLKTRRDIIFIDLAGVGSITFNKFLGYYLEPTCTYMVTLTGGRDRGVRISVGSNPWRPFARRHDISAICAKFGGGGHAVVGGVNLPQATVDRGRAVAREIMGYLSRPPEG